MAKNLYKVLRQEDHDERLFVIKNLSNESVHQVDLYTDGAFIPPEGVDETPESLKKWLHDKFVGKIIEIEELIPYAYFTNGKQKIID